MTEEARCPRVLAAADGAEITRLRPSAVSVEENMTPPSTATMTLPEGEPTVSVRQMVELYRPGATFGVYRVTSASIAYGDEQQIRLEHGITTLADTLLVPPSGGDATISGSMADVLSQILSHQTGANTAMGYWVLGDVDVPAEQTITVSIDGVTAMDAIADAMEQAPGYMLSYNQVSRPWILSVKALQMERACEVRMRRNMANVTLEMDTSDLCTRVYSDKLLGGYLDADTVSQWGVVGQALDIADGATEAQARAAAERYLAARKNPVPTITVDAMALAEETREPLDAFTVGSVCRVALPDWGFSYMDERVVTVSYEDVISAPEKVRLTLARPKKDAGTRISTLSRTTRSNSRGVRRNGGAIADAEQKIAIQAQEILVKADRIELDAYVKISELEAKTLYVIDGATIGQLFIENNLDAGEISTGPLWAGPTEVDSLLIGDKPAATQEYVTSRGYWVNGSSTINVGGAARGVHTLTVVTDIGSDGKPVKRRFQYVGSASTEVK